MRIWYVRNRRGASWAGHGRYLARADAQRAAEPGLGFDFEHDNVNLARTLGQWQRAGDPWFWGIVISPEHGDRLDLRAHTRAFVAQVARDLGTELEWTAIDHHDTDHAHVHLLVRGRDVGGQPLEIAPTYIKSGALEGRSRELATRVLGFRTERMQLVARGRTLEQASFTEIDRALLGRASERRVVTYDGWRPKARYDETRHRQETQRLQFLEGLGLAAQTGDRTWRLSDALESTLRQARAAAYRAKSRKRREPTQDRSSELVRPAHEQEPPRERAR